MANYLPPLEVSGNSAAGQEIVLLELEFAYLSRTFNTKEEQFMSKFHYQFIPAISPQKSRRRLLTIMLALALLLLLPAASHAQSASSSSGSTPLAWSPEGNNLAIGQADGSVRVWNKKAEIYIATLRDLDEAVTSIAWSPDGSSLAASTEDGTVQVWDTETWDRLATLDGPEIGNNTAASANSESASTSTSATATPVSTPTVALTSAPTKAAPTRASTKAPTKAPTQAPTVAPTEAPSTAIDMTGASLISIEEAASNPNNYYRLQTLWLEGENKCFEGNRPDADRFLGGAAYMDECQDVTGQLWKITLADNGYYRLQTMWLEDEDKCLESNQLDSSRFLGGATYMDACQNVSGQHWQFVPAKEGYYQLQSEWLAPENKCLEGNRPGPDWILDGAAHMADCDDVTGQLWKIVPAQGATTSSSSGSTNTSTTSSVAASQPAQPSTGGAVSGRIAFPAFENGNWSIYVVNANGSSVQKVRGSASQPALSPDGQRIAFRNWESDNRSVSVMDVSGGNVKRLSDFLEDGLPSWSPDGKTVVFFSRRNGDRKSRIHQASVENGNEWNVGDVRGEYPTWLPSGRIVYRATSPQISLSVMNNDGGNSTPIFPDGDATAPAISPDGKTILFMTKRDGNWEIYRIVNGDTGPTRLTTNSTNDGLPAWSPDGQTIAFATDRSGYWAIWLMNADGSNQRELRAIPGTLDGRIAGEPDFSARGWTEERISWSR